MLNGKRTLVMMLSVACVLTIAAPAAAQTSKTTRRTSRPSVVRVRTQSRGSSARTQVRSTRSSRARLRAAPAATRSNLVRVNRATSSSRQRAAISRPTVIRPRINVAARKSRTSGTNLVTYRRQPDGGTDRDDYVATFRRRPDQPIERDRRVVTRRRYYRPYDGYGYGYYNGYTYGYYRGYHRGYHVGYTHGYYDAHYHYYGPHLVFGWHFGGFGFYHGRWHFALVLGDPYVRHHRHYYHYSWWDGCGTSLMTWDRAVQAYPADYVFSGGACVELWLRTTQGDDYTIKIDPRYWNARDPGELYAAFWSELEREGRLQIQDINGAVHIFPAGLIQQIEARACR